MDLVFQSLAAIHSLSDDFRRALEGEMVLLSFPKLHLLAEAPRVADHAYFLVRGLAMGYTFADGVKQVTNFWKPGQVVFTVRSFCEQTACREYIQLLMSSEVYCINYAGVKRLAAEFPEANRLFKGILIQCYDESRVRLREQQDLPVAARHRRLLETYPSIEQLTTQENIASYLGVAPQSLSRIKRRDRKS